MLSVFVNIISIFTITLIGFIASKLKWLPLESSKYLSTIMINISGPCLIIFSLSQQELNPMTLLVAQQVIIVMLLMLIIASLISIPTVNRMGVLKADRGVYRALLVLTNNGFMGYPLALAVFGKDGLFLMILANAIFCIFMYSAGVYLMIYDRQEKLNLMIILKSLFSIPVISSIIGFLIFMLSIELPPVLANFLDTLWSMTIPLSMLVIGIQLSQSNVKQVIQNRHLSMLVFLRLVISPVILFILFFKFPIDPRVLVIAVFAMAMPSAAIAVVLADIHKVNAKITAEGVFLTTLFSLITIPVISMMLTYYLGVLV